jgi:predicted outer membrane repeat protein
MGGAMYAGAAGYAIEVGCYAINCTFINNTAAAQGGALFGGSARNCTFWHNQAESVGGALVGNAYDCVFTENSADYSGGAVYGGFLFEDTYVVNCTFRNNSARFGGAVSDCIVINSTFIDNYATESGGAISQGSAETCTFINNSAGISGGAIAGASALNCTFKGNHAIEGGAMDANGFKAVNCLFVNNSAQNGGATHYVAVYNCRFTNNSATESGGAMYAGVCSDSNFTQNHAGINGGAVCDAVVSNSLFGYNSAENGGAVTGGKVADSIFSYNVATDYGGAVYHAKVSTDNQFNNNVAPNGNDTYDVVWFDKRNAKTFYDLNSLINANNDSDVYLNDDYIFDPHYDFDFIGGVVISRAVTVHGNSHSIDGYDVTRMFRVTNSSAVFMDIDFVNGKVTYSEDGGAIKGKSTAVNCNFVNNSATSQYSDGGALDECNAVGCTFINNHAGANGGAIYFANAENCTFINNHADKTGGAVYQGRATDCDFTDNSAVDAGAVYGTAENCIFTGNRATRYGGAMYLGSAYDCIFIGNVDQYGNDTYSTQIYKSSFTASNFTSTYKSGAKLRVNLVSASGEQVTDAKITVKVYKNDALFGTYSFSSGTGWTVNLDAGDYRAVLSVENQGYAVDSVNVTLKISQASTTLLASAVTATYNVNKNLVVTLKDAKGALANKKVTVKVGTISKTLTTNSKGQVSVDVSSLIPKEYTASIKFAGDSNFKTSSKSVKVTVKKATPKVVASAKAFKLADKTKKYVVTFKTNTNKPLKGVTVYIKVNGITYSAKTSSNGQATFKLTKLKKVGKFSSVITFKGNTYYNKLSKTVKITVKK